MSYQGLALARPQLGQKFAGVLALMISASSWPMFLKLCGKVVGM